MENEKQIDDLVSLLDGFMDNGGGHMNVDADIMQTETVQVNTSQCNECSTGKWATACAVPTFMEEPYNEEENK